MVTWSLGILGFKQILRPSDILHSLLAVTKTRGSTEPTALSYSVKIFSVFFSGTIYWRVLAESVLRLGTWHDGRQLARLTLLPYHFLEPDNNKARTRFRNMECPIFERRSFVLLAGSPTSLLNDNSSKPDKRQLAQFPASPFPFLELPIDVRLMVYQYLVPNQRSEQWCGAPQRHGGLAYPAILRVNHQMRLEVLPEWYNKSVLFEASIFMLRFQFLDRGFSLYQPLPSTFRHIRSFCLKIDLEWTTAPPTTFKDGIAECIPQLSALRKLQVFLCISLLITVDSVIMNNKPGKVKAAFEATMSPLQALHGLEIALLDISIQRFR
jgi:hypothetical protein